MYIKLQDHEAILDLRQRKKKNFIVWVKLSSTFSFTWNFSYMTIYITISMSIKKILSDYTLDLSLGSLMILGPGVFLQMSWKVIQSNIIPTALHFLSLYDFPLVYYWVKSHKFKNLLLDNFRHVVKNVCDSRNAMKI